MSCSWNKQDQDLSVHTAAFQSQKIDCFISSYYESTFEEIISRKVARI
jgi:CRISPR/Cas system-associated endonuclease Cas3-HD